LTSDWNFRLRTIVYPWVKVIAGLAAALLAARFLCPVPPRHLFSSGLALIASALVYVALIALAAIVSMRFVRTESSIYTRCAAAAVWAAPLAILATERSAWVAIPLIALVILATPLFGLNRDAPPPSADFHLLRQLPSSFIVAVFIQLAAIAAMIRFPGVAGILVSIGAAMLVWRVTAVDPQARSRPRRAVALTILAIAFTIFGMLPYQSSWLAAGAERAAGAGDSDPASGTTGDGILADSFRGVILLPEIQHRVTLVAPLPLLSRNPFREKKTSLDIPFYGVYWFFRMPNMRPPQGSIEMHGKPSELTFRSHDSRPLTMEGHQSLGTPFQIGCCRSVRLAITNRDRFTGSVAIELILVDTFEAGKPFQSLGILTVQSAYGMDEVLEYPIPRSSAISQFDEFTIRFHRPYLHARESANVAIDRFILQPR
jgi:hypothetical protein